MQICNKGFLTTNRDTLETRVVCSRAIHFTLRLCWVSLGILVMLGFSMNCAPFYVCYFRGVAVRPNLRTSNFFYYSKTRNYLYTNARARILRRNTQAKTPSPAGWDSCSVANCKHIFGFYYKLTLFIHTFGCTLRVA